jgi:small subunit ribosomal protein S17
MAETTKGKGAQPGPKNTPITQKPRGRRKTAIGYVVSDKMDKTIVVEIESRAQHPKYGKIVVQTRRYKVHDEENTCKIGDRVRIQETRPLSKTKRWQVKEILNIKAT